MSQWTTRHISYAGSAVAIEHPAAEASAGARIVEALFGTLGSDSSLAPKAVYHIRPGGADERRLTLHRGLTLIYEGDCVARLAALLLHDVTQQLAQRCRRGLLFHAAVLGWNGRAVLLPGRSGAGKTSLAAWLATRGFDYLGDELAFVPDGQRRVHGFRRALSVKASGRAMLARVLTGDEHADELLAMPEASLVPARLLGARNVVEDVEHAITVHPQFEAGAELAVQRLSPAEAGLALMECLVNARNLELHGFPAVARVARQVPGWRMVFGDPDAAAATLTALLEAERSRPTAS